jgi:hypothetical protein
MASRVVHFEIPYEDAQRAYGFYQQVFDWTINEMPELDYTAAVSGPVDEGGMPSEPGFINGGMFRRDPALPDHPILTIDVDSIDDTLEAVEQHGGSVVQAKETVADLGFTAYVRDSEGNVVGLWESAGSS